MGKNKTEIVIGLVAGAGLVGHALIQGSHAWPLIWPLLGGLAAGLLAKAGASGGFKAGGAAGLAAAFVIVLLGAPAIMLTAGDLIAERTASLDLPFEGAGFVLLAMAILALISLVLAVVAGLIGGALASRRR